MNSPKRHERRLGATPRDAGIAETLRVLLHSLRERSAIVLHHMYSLQRLRHLYQLSSSYSRPRPSLWQRPEGKFMNVYCVAPTSVHRIRGRRGRGTAPNLKCLAQLPPPMQSEATYALIIHFFSPRCHCEGDQLCNEECYRSCAPSHGCGDLDAGNSDHEYEGRVVPLFKVHE